MFSLLLLLLPLSLFLLHSAQGFEECDKPRRLRDEAYLRQHYPKLLQYIHKHSNYSGTVLLLNYQDLTLNLDCPDLKGANYTLKDRDGTPLWKIWSFKAEEAEFKAKGLNGDAIRVSTPNPQAYYRDYACFRRDIKHSKASPRGCNQYFNVFTRPLPKTTFTVRQYEGWRVEFECSVHPDVLQKKNDAKKEDITPKINPPYQIKWIIPADLKREEEKGVVTTPKGKVEIEKAFGPNEVVVIEEMDSRGSVVKSRVVIKKASKVKHDGKWECVIIDGHSLTSRMSTELGGKKIPEEKRFKGHVSVHIRSWSWPIAGGVIVAVIIILVVILILCCPDNITEYDPKAGEKETGGTLVKPESPSSPSGKRHVRKVQDSTQFKSDGVAGSETGELGVGGGGGMSGPAVSIEVIEDESDVEESEENEL